METIQGQTFSIMTLDFTVPKLAILDNLESQIFESCGRMGG